MKELKKQAATKLPKATAYLEGQLFDGYVHNMKIVQKYAVYNRKAMAEAIITFSGLHIDDSFTTVHNDIDTEAMILRKGAVSAGKGEKILIPVNMCDGNLICTGKGTPTGTALPRTAPDDWTAEYRPHAYSA